MCASRSWSGLLSILALVACGDSGDSGGRGETSEQDSQVEVADAGDTATYAIQASGQLTADEQGVAFVSQNGAIVYVPAADLIGKQVVWLVTEGGEIPPNASFLDLGTTTIGDDLSFAFQTKSAFADGAWELTTFILVEGTDFTEGPQMGDLAAYTPLETMVPQGDPEVTGVTVRVRVQGADARVLLDNTHFVRF